MAVIPAGKNIVELTGSDMYDYMRKRWPQQYAGKTDAELKAVFERGD